MRKVETKGTARRNNKKKKELAKLILWRGVGEKQLLENGERAGKELVIRENTLR